MSKTIAEAHNGRSDDHSADKQASGLVYLKQFTPMRRRLGISMPEVGIYEGEANAFATGASRNNAMVAVSTGLLSA